MLRSKSRHNSSPRKSHTSHHRSRNKPVYHEQRHYIRSGATFRSDISTDTDESYIESRSDSIESSQSDPDDFLYINQNNDHRSSSKRSHNDRSRNSNDEYIPERKRKETRTVSYTHLTLPTILRV